ncbi:tail fiber protein, partial [Flavobacteriales bacterium]|nr:tail fiber protein [Flavobacteriales bacterium]
TASTNRSTLNVTGEIQQHGFALVPVGGIIMWTGSAVPSGWALCNGGTYGKIDGSGNITSPDLKGRFIVGVDPSDTDYDDIGINGNVGTKTTTLTQSQMPSHTHTLNIVSGGNHQHKALIDHGGGGSYGTDPGPGNAMWTDGDNDSGMSSNNPIANGILPTDYQGSHDHSGSSNSPTGANASHENRPPYYALAFIIKL